jgi:hypothetical protein
MSFAVDKCAMYDKFMDTLSTAQKQKYRKIVSERRTIYMSGYLLGFILSGLYILVFAKDYSEMLLCTIAAITFFTSYFFYILYPKSELMILDLDEKTQRKEWIAIYKKMQYHYHFGMVLGILAVVFYAKGVCA